MSFVNVTEYAGGAVEPSRGSYDLPLGPEQATSKPFKEGTTVLRLLPDQDCRIVISENPEVGLESTLLLGGQVEFINIIGFGNRTLRIGVKSI